MSGIFIRILKKITPKYFTRPMIKFVKQQNKKIGQNNLIGVEIGVYRGRNAKNILSILPIKKLYLIDPYLSTNNDQYSDEDLEIAKKKLAKFRSKVVFIKKKSEDSADDVPNNLDFVYIDGNHSYEFVKKDIELFYPKVSKNGVIGGHDFKIAGFGNNPDVVMAVIEFCKKKNIDFCSAENFGNDIDWWIVKK